MSRKSGMGSHESSRMGKDEWLTPPEIIKTLGEFDLDPCHPDAKVAPWFTCPTFYSKDGLSAVWHGRVWMNPPYGSQTGKWLEKLASHGTGTALVFARTETKMFFDHVWPKADAILFLKGRLYFYHVSGKKADMNAGAPSCLIAYGKEDALKLKESGLEGYYVSLK